MKTLTSQRFQPDLESLTDRIVPSTTALFAMANRMFTMLADARQLDYSSGQQGQPARDAVRADVIDLGSDVIALRTEVQTGINNLVTWFQAQPADYQANALDSVAVLIAQMQEDEKDIDALVYQVAVAISSIEYDVDKLVQDYQQNNQQYNQSAAPYAPVGTDSAKLARDIANAEANIVPQISQFLYSAVDLYGKLNVIDQVCVAPATAAAQSAAAQSSCCS